jgi:uncharacterized membrane protein YkgB
MATHVESTPDLERRALRRLSPALEERVRRADDRISGFLDRYGVTLLRIAVATVFIWFGVLKVIDRSPVADLVADTVYFLPADFFVRFLGAWEIAVGVGLLIPVALRLTLLLFWAQMAGTFLVLIVHPDLSFQSNNPLLLTVTGEFVVKNLVLITAGLVIGSQVRRPRAAAS